MATPGDTRASGAQGDWVVQTTDRIESVVVSIRSKTTVPITLAARAIVYGLIVLVAATSALVLLTIALVRIWDVYVPGDVWIGYGTLGILFVLSGLIVWRFRRPKKS